MATHTHKILVVCTSTSTMGDSHHKTGLWLEECTHFLHYMVNGLGYDYDIVSTKGGEVPIDPGSGEKSDKKNNKFRADEKFLNKLKTSLAPSQVKPDDYVAIYYAGGHGTMWDFRENQEIAKIAAAIYEKGNYVAAVCHGVAGLLPITLSNGDPLLKNKKVTGFSNAEENALGLTKAVPYLLETELVSKGAKYKSRWPFSAEVVVSERLLTGKNPNSTHDLAVALGKELATKYPAPNAGKHKEKHQRHDKHAHKVLVVTTSVEKLDSGKAAGVVLEEIATFVGTLTKYNFEYDVASPKGGKVPVDPASLKTTASQALTNNKNLSQKLDNSHKLSEVNPSAYSIVYIAGGYGALLDLSKDESLAKVVNHVYSLHQHGLVVTVSFGAAGLLNVKTSDGKYLVNGHKVTTFSTTEETLLGLKGELPYVLEEELVKKGAHYSKTTVPFMPNVVTSTVNNGTIISGQNPGSTNSVAKAAVLHAQSHHI